MPVGFCRQQPMRDSYSKMGLLDSTRETKQMATLAPIAKVCWEERKVVRAQRAPLCAGGPRSHEAILFSFIDSCWMPPAPANCKAKCWAFQSNMARSALHSGMAGWKSKQIYTVPIWQKAKKIAGPNLFKIVRSQWICAMRRKLSV